jgi:hypothetical protein
MSERLRIKLDDGEYEVLSSSQQTKLGRDILLLEPPREIVMQAGMGHEFKIVHRKYEVLEEKQRSGIPLATVDSLKMDILGVVGGSNER